MAAGTRQYAVSIDVPRAGGWRAWNTAAERFEQRLTAGVRPPVLEAQIDSETRQGLDYVRIRVIVAVRAADVAEAIGAAWGVFQEAAGEVGGWDVAAARAEVHPAAAQRAARGRPARRRLTARLLPARPPATRRASTRPATNRGRPPSHLTRPRHPARPRPAAPPGYAHFFGVG